MIGRISEIFESIQGEGVYLGERQVFVRFFGCNLECKFCDTKLQNYSEYQPQALFDEIKEYPGDFHSISFTGGEPLLQKDFLKEILILTSNAGFKNYLETNGTLASALSEVIDYLDIVAMDLKLPTSTGASKFWQEHRSFLNIAKKKDVFLKAVICHSTEDEDLKAGIELIKDIDPKLILVLQPNSLQDDLALKEKLDKFSNACFRENINFQIIPQVHKLIGIK